MRNKKCIRNMPAPVSGAYVSRCLLAVSNRWTLPRVIEGPTMYLGLPKNARASRQFGTERFKRECLTWAFSLVRGALLFDTLCQ